MSGIVGLVGSDIQANVLVRDCLINDYNFKRRTEFSRLCVPENVWLESEKKFFQEHDGKNFVYEDVRFPFEADFIRALGGRILHVSENWHGKFSDFLGSRYGILALVGDCFISTNVLLGLRS
jgi:hypothetical protein